MSPETIGPNASGQIFFQPFLAAQLAEYLLACLRLQNSKSLPGLRVGTIVAFLIPLPFLMKRPSAAYAAAAQGMH